MSETIKLTKTPVTIELDRPRRVIFNMRVRKQLEELQDAGELNIAEIFQPRDGKYAMDWEKAMRFVTVALREDAEAHGETLEVDDLERKIESIPQAVAITTAVFTAYNRFLGVEPQGEDRAVSEKAADGAPKSGPARRHLRSAAANTESHLENSGD